MRYTVEPGAPVLLVDVPRGRAARTDSKTTCFGTGEMSLRLPGSLCVTGTRIVPADLPPELRALAQTPWDTASRAKDYAQVLRAAMGNLEAEWMLVLCFNARLRLHSWFAVTVGSAKYTVVNTSGILRGVIASGCEAYILVHNHPSGDPTPSRQDLQSTTQIQSMGNQIGIKLMDHLIVGGDRVVSMAEEGAL